MDWAGDSVGGLVQRCTNKIGKKLRDVDDNLP